MLLLRFFFHNDSGVYNNDHNQDPILIENPHPPEPLVGGGTHYFCHKRYTSGHLCRFDVIW